MSKYITYTISTLEPIKVSPTSMQSDYEYSKSYIPGTAIRGAIISKYIAANNTDNINKGIHRQRLLTGNIIFHNAYPLYKNTRCYPMIKGFYGKKDSIKQFNISDIDGIDITMNKHDFKDECVDSIKNIDFCRFDYENDRLYKASVSKKSFVHIAKGKINEDNKIFRYEAINKGQSFKGIIEFKNEEDVDCIKKILEGGKLYIGGSKGSGYGLCKVFCSDILNFNPQLNDLYYEDLEDIFEDEDLNEIYLYSVSDILYRDNMGKYRTSIDPEFIKNKLMLEEVKLEYSFIDTEMCTSFNAKWGYRTPMITGIKKGSILKYKIKGNINVDLLEKLIQEGIGERKIDGYGQIAIFSSIEFGELCNEKESIKEVELCQIFSNEDKTQLQTIANRIYKEKLKNSFDTEVLKMKERLRGNINNNQLGKLYTLMMNIENMKSSDGIKRFEDYMNHIIDKNNNRINTNQFLEVKIDNVEISKYIINFLSKNSLEQFEAKFNSFRLGSIKPEFSEQEMYRYNVRILKEVFRTKCREVQSNGN